MLRRVGVRGLRAQRSTGAEDSVCAETESTGKASSQGTQRLAIRPGRSWWSFKWPETTPQFSKEAKKETQRYFH